MWQELPAGRRQRDAIAVAHEELAPQLLLKTPDPRADGGLGEVQPARRDGEAAMRGNLEETAQIFSVHGFTLHRRFR